MRLNSFSFKNLLIFAYCGAGAIIYADASIAYITGQASDKIYKINLLDGNFSTITPSPSLTGARLCGIALQTPEKGYVTGVTSDIIYSFDLTTGNNSSIASIPGTGTDRIALANDTTAYVTSFNNGNVYEVEVNNGNITQTTSFPIPSDLAAGIALNMGLETPNTAWVTNDSGIYQVNLANGAISQLLTTASGTNLRGIAIMNNTTAYTVGLLDSNIYRVNLTNGELSLVASLPLIVGSPEGIVLTNSTTAYVVAGTFNIRIYRIDLINGDFSLVTSITDGTLSFDIQAPLQIGTNNLTGNNLRFANYLNENASFRVLPLFALQDDIAATLQSAIPTRNAISTFAAQTTQLALGQLVYDHIAQKHPMGKLKKNLQATQMQTNALPLSELIAVNDSREISYDHDLEMTSTYNNQVQEKNRSVWLGTFAQYSREKAQLQTPEFQANSLGGIIAFDYLHNHHALMGGGFAYGYTHVHEKQKVGHADVNQGAAVFYAALQRHSWNANLAFWGGYYHINNVRNIVIPQIAEASATSKTHGWQFTPHFEASYKNHPTEWLIIEPFNMIDWVACWENGFQEQGAGILNMGQKSRFCSLLRNELGIHFYEKINFDWGVIRFLETCGYAYQKTFGTGRIDTFLVGSPAALTVSTLTGAQNLGVFEFETFFLPNNGTYPYGTISYQGEFGSSYQTHSIMLSAGIDF